MLTRSASQFTAGTLFIAPLAIGAGLLTKSFAATAVVGAVIAIAWSWPEWVLALLLASAPFVRSLSPERVSPEMLMMIKTSIALLLGGLWLLRRLLAREQESLPAGMGILCALWAGLLALSTLHAVNPMRSIAYIPLTLAGIAVFTLVWNADRVIQRRLLLGVLGLGAAMGLLVALQYVTVTYGYFSSIAHFIVEPRTQAYYSENPLGETSGRFRPSGTMFHPNSMGLFFTVIMPFATAIGFASRAPVFWRIVGKMTAGLALCGLYATNSRAATLAAVVGLLYLGVRAGYRRVAAGAAVIVAIVGLTVLTSHGGLREALESFARVDAGLSGRGTIWANTFTLIQQEPFFGVGPANFTSQYVAHFGYFLPNNVQEQMGQIWAIQNIPAAQFINNFHAHNIYLQLSGELGLCGPLLFLSTMLWFLGQSERRESRHPTGSLSRAMAVGSGALALSIMAYGFFDSQYSFTFDAINLITGALLATGIGRTMNSEVRV